MKRERQTGGTSIQNMTCDTSRKALIGSAIALFVSATSGLAQAPPPTECGALIHAAEASGFVPFPQGDLFCRLTADPKETRSFVAYQRGKSSGQLASEAGGNPVSLAPFDTDIGAIGVGDAFGLLRWAGPRPGDGVQVSVAAAVFAQFDLATSSFDLINADYIVGLPLTFRRSGFSGRIRVYHQSSHLGDEFLLRDEPERINLSFESLELILSQALGSLRVYAGGEALFDRDPAELEPLVAHAGSEFRVGAFGRRSLLAAVDLKSSEEQDWKPAWSARAGFEVGWGRDPQHPPRVVRLLGEYYRGPSPYGQFYRENLRYWGVGLHLFP